MAMKWRNFDDVKRIAVSSVKAKLYVLTDQQARSQAADRRQQVPTGWTKSGWTTIKVRMFFAQPFQPGLHICWN
jgi:hypothetical protein